MITTLSNMLTLKKRSTQVNSSSVVRSKSIDLNSKLQSWKIGYSPHHFYYFLEDEDEYDKEVYVWKIKLSEGSYHGDRLYPVDSRENIGKFNNKSNLDNFLKRFTSIKQIPTKYVDKVIKYLKDKSKKRGGKSRKNKTQKKKINKS